MADIDSDVDYSYKLKRSFSTALTFFLFLGFFVPTGLAQSTTQTSQTPSSVGTVILVNGGDVSTIDAAIAASISADTGVPVFYTDHNDISVDLHKALHNLGVKNVVVLGGEAVVGERVLDSLNQFGYEANRIAGTSGTGTAVQAINYFYGPEMTDQVSLVSYKGDADKSLQDRMSLAAQLGHGPVIPIPEDVEGLPADVAEVVHNLGAQQITLVGDFQAETDVKADLQDVGTKVSTEFSGATDKELAPKMWDNVVDRAISQVKVGGPNFGVIMVERGQVPPTLLPGQVVVYYNKPNVADPGFVVLDPSVTTKIPLRGPSDDGSVVFEDQVRFMIDGINEKGKQNGVKVGEIKCTGTHKKDLDQFKENFEKNEKDVKVGVQSGDSVDTSIKFADQQKAEIVKKADTYSDKWDNLKEEHKADFSKALPSMVNQFKSYYLEGVESGKITDPELLEVGAKIVEETNKNDAPAQWALMAQFGSRDMQLHFNSCGDASCKQEFVESEQKETLDKRVETIVGTEKATEVTNLNAGQKIGLASITQFTSPIQIGEVSTVVKGFLDFGAPASEVATKYTESKNQEAQTAAYNNFKKEYDALPAASKTAFEKAWGTKPAEWTPEKIKANTDNRLTLQAYGYQAGFYDPKADAATRGQVLANAGNMYNHFNSAGVKAQYMPSGQWHQAYNQFSPTGSITADQIKTYKAAGDFGQAWEETNPGSTIDPRQFTWNAQTGQVSVYDPRTGAIVSGFLTPRQVVVTDVNTGAVDVWKPGSNGQLEKIPQQQQTGWTCQGNTCTSLQNGLTTTIGMSYPSPADYQTPTDYLTPTPTYQTPWGYPTPSSYPTPTDRNYQTPTYPTPAPGYMTPTYPTPGPGYQTPTYSYPSPYMYPTPGQPYPTPASYQTPSGYPYPTPSPNYQTPTSYPYPTPGYQYPSPTGTGNYPTPNYVTPTQYPYPTPGGSYPTPYAYPTPGAYEYPSPTNPGAYGTPSTTSGYPYPTPPTGTYAYPTPSGTYGTPSYGTPSYGTPSYGTPSYTTPPT